MLGLPTLDGAWRVAHRASVAMGQSGRVAASSIIASILGLRVGQGAEAIRRSQGQASATDQGDGHCSWREQDRVPNATPPRLLSVTEMNNDYFSSQKRGQQYTRKKVPHCAARSVGRAYAGRLLAIGQRRPAPSMTGNG